MIDKNDFYEVVIPDESGTEWFYWVECDDEDDAFDIAVERHEELGRPDLFEDMDAGIIAGAYQPVIDDNQSIAVIIRTVSE